MKISKKNYTLNLVAWCTNYDLFENTFLEISNVHAPVKKLF